MPVAATAAQKQAYAEAKINVVSQSGTSFTFECEEIPSIDLPVTLYAGGTGGSGSGVPAGGTTGQALVKKSNTDGDVEWKDVDNSVFEIHFANNAVDVTYSQLGEAFSANKTLKLIDTENNVVLAFTGYYSGVYYFSTICLNGRQEMVNTSIVLYQSALSSDVVATQVQRLTLTEDVQKIEMPTAAATFVNKVYQYIGTTDANYTHGLFYTCVNDSGTYKWVQLDVQTYPEVNLNNVFAGGMPSANMTGQQIHYSTNEQVVGTWIDGKPIYQKTINFTTPSTSGTFFTIPEIVDISKLVNIDGYMLPSNGWRGRINTYQSPTSFTFWNFNEDTKQFYFSTPSSEYLSCDACVTLQYTKTTD